jgi:CubicO group peptidase (beta-lactamase class C family)
VTVRDLLTMRTGLPRHDWVWLGSEMTRADLMERLPYLDLSADFRQRFQYCNLSASAAGHIAEVLTGKTWEALVREKIFGPLKMRKTTCVRPAHRNITSSFHENERRKLIATSRSASALIAPAGGAIHSTVLDMCRWLLFNLGGGKAGKRRLIRAQTLAQIHFPQVIVGDRPLARLPAQGAYALGWVVDHYNGHRRISHGGYLHDVQSSVMFFPDAGVGMVSFINFGCPFLADFINQQVFDLTMGLQPVQTLEQRLAEYEHNIEQTRKRNAAIVRVAGTRPTHAMLDYAGRYEHPGYGEIKIRTRGRKLFLHRHDLRLPLKHWHYDVWIAQDNDRWVIHQPRAFDRACQIQFHTGRNGDVAALTVPLELEVPPLRFEKRSNAGERTSAGARW